MDPLDNSVPLPEMEMLPHATTQLPMDSNRAAQNALLDMQKFSIPASNSVFATPHHPNLVQQHIDPFIGESLAPLFQPFGVDVNHFPMTNPPIFQNMTTGAGHQRHRRISISNGQNGQLIQGGLEDENVYNLPPPPMPQIKQQPSADMGVDAFGSEGPIPGTQAWKRARLLEKNRIAASKCRERKKKAQMELQENISKYQDAADIYRKRLFRYNQVIKSVQNKISLHMKVCPGSDLSLMLDELHQLGVEDKMQGIKIDDIEGE